MILTRKWPFLEAIIFRYHSLNFGGSFFKNIRFSPRQDAPIAATHRLYRSTETGSAPLAMAEVQERRSASGGSKRQKKNVASMSVSSERLFSYPNFQYTRRFSLPFLQQGFPIPKDAGLMFPYLWGLTLFCWTVQEHPDGEFNTKYLGQMMSRPN